MPAMLGPVTSSTRADRFEADVVGDEGLPRHHGLDHRMAARLEDQGRPVVHLGADVPLAHRHLGERGPDVQPGQCPSGPLDPSRRTSHPFTQRGEELGFAHGHPLLRTQDLRLVVLELRRHVPLGAGQRLAPLVVGRDPLLVGVGDLEVVAEDLVVSHLERRNAGAIPLPLLQAGDVLPAAVAEIAQLSSSAS